MRVVRFEYQGATGWGILQDSGVVQAPQGGSVEDVVASGVEGLAHDLSACTRVIPLADVRLLQPLSRPSKIIGLARNYRDHAPRDGSPDPMPLLFGMLPSAMIGPDDTIEIPAIAHMIDWEVELGIVIGRRARKVRA